MLDNSIFASILNTVIDNGRISATDPDDFESQLRAQVEFEAMEQGLSDDETSEAVDFALAHAHL